MLARKFVEDTKLRINENLHFILPNDNQCQDGN